MNVPAPELVAKVMDSGALQSGFPSANVAKTPHRADALLFQADLTNDTGVDSAIAGTVAELTGGLRAQGARKWTTVVSRGWFMQ